MANAPSPHRRAFLRGMTATVGMLAAPARLVAARQAGGPGFSPEDFGAVGDGRTDDTAAFQALGKAVSDRGGGTVTMRRGATYRVGRQGAAPGGAGPAYASQPMLLFEKVDGLMLVGNGATLKLNDGLRYGSFDPATGRPYDPPKGRFTDRGYGAVVGNMVEFADSRNIQVANLILDGNADRLVVGGRWGDVGIQLRATGLQITRSTRITIEDVVSRNHGLDGVYLYGSNVAATGGSPDDIVLRRVRSDRNGRQGMSVVGGNTFLVEDCTFSNTGQGALYSQPSAGVDIEPNGGNWTTNLSFVNCAFVNNRQVGLVADKGNSDGITIRGCTFWQGFAELPGVTRGSGDAFWIKRQTVLIDGCRVHGNVTNLSPTTEVRRTSFDDAVHPVYGRSARRRSYLLDQAGGSFTDCGFTVEGGGGFGLVCERREIAFRRCRFRFAASDMPAARAIAIFSPLTTLEDASFAEGPRLGGQRHFIDGNGARLTGKVTVAGPNIRWGSPRGPIGDVAAAGPS